MKTHRAGQVYRDVRSIYDNSNIWQIRSRRLDGRWNAGNGWGQRGIISDSELDDPNHFVLTYNPAKKVHRLPHSFRARLSRPVNFGGVKYSQGSDIYVLARTTVSRRLYIKFAGLPVYGWTDPYYLDLPMDIHPHLNVVTSVNV